MIAAQLAEKIRARQVRGGWRTLCPAHDDRTASLDIKQGDKCILLCCRSHGCSVKAICAAWGFPVKCLFSDEHLTPAQQNGLAKTRARQAAVEAEQNRRESQLLDEWRRLGSLRKQIEALMIANPESAAFNEVHGATLARLRQIAAVLWPDLFEDGPLRSEPMEITSAWVSGQMEWVGKNFHKKNDDAENVANFTTKKVGTL